MRQILPFMISKHFSFNEQHVELLIVVTGNMVPREKVERLSLTIPIPRELTNTTFTAKEGKVKMDVANDTLVWRCVTQLIGTMRELIGGVGTQFRIGFSAKRSLSAGDSC